ncbi:Ribosomal RNA small subunit methyltransferase I [Chlamydiales bacterium STE3]|nr:Ribosomal RNA small subunit methyltransferase I [Chlamydiales bacterium STE3]
MLFLVATPIGNLSDITFRAIETLKSCDLILCEDTRHTLKLLNHYEIKKPLYAYHKFNESATLEKIIIKLKEGNAICLVSDAGTPLIADPGYVLLQRCIQESIEVTALPGPCAAINALILSGFDSRRFQFVGFLPKQQKELIKALQEYIPYPGVTLGYESPERITKTVTILSEIAPQLSIAIARELTKKFEQVLRGTALEVVNQLHQTPIKGECILLLQGQPSSIDYSDLSIEEHIQQIEKAFSLSRKEAIKIVAEQRHSPKRNIYKEALKTKQV